MYNNIPQGEYTKHVDPIRTTCENYVGSDDSVLTRFRKTACIREVAGRVFPSWREGINLKYNHIEAPTISIPFHHFHHATLGPHVRDGNSMESHVREHYWLPAAGENYWAVGKIFYIFDITNLPLLDKNEQQRLVMSKISEKLLPTAVTNQPLRAVLVIFHENWGTHLPIL